MGSNNNIQETKLVVIDDYILCQLLGTGFDYAFLPAANTRGGGVYWSLGKLPSGWLCASRLVPSQSRLGSSA
jgi:hypothetical protein